jgi:hypothetical protein
LLVQESPRLLKDRERGIGVDEKADDFIRHAGTIGDMAKPRVELGLQKSYAQPEITRRRPAGGRIVSMGAFLRGDFESFNSLIETTETGQRSA